MDQLSALTRGLPYLGPNLVWELDTLHERGFELTLILRHTGGRLLRIEPVCDSRGRVISAGHVTRWDVLRTAQKSAAAYQKNRKSLR